MEIILVRHGIAEDMVGHMPDLAELASTLLPGRPDLDIEFRKAAACCLACGPRPVPGRARLRWHMPPRVLRALAGAE